MQIQEKKLREFIGLKKGEILRFKYNQTKKFISLVILKKKKMRQ